LFKPGPFWAFFNSELNVYKLINLTKYISIGFPSQFSINNTFKLIYKKKVSKRGNNKKIRKMNEIYIDKGKNKSPSLRYNNKYVKKDFWVFENKSTRSKFLPQLFEISGSFLKSVIKLLLAQFFLEFVHLPCCHVLFLVDVKKKTTESFRFSVCKCKKILSYFLF
jgi:hypothetical protein